MRRSENGQSVLEYVIVLTAIIAVIIIAARGIITTSVNNTMNSASQTIDQAASRLP